MKQIMLTLAILMQLFRSPASDIPKFESSQVIVVDYFQTVQNAKDIFNIYFLPVDGNLKVNVRDASTYEFNPSEGRLSVTLPQNKKGDFTVTFYSYGSNITEYTKVFYYDTRRSTKSDIIITDYFQDASASDDLFNIYFKPFDSSIKVYVEGATINKLDSSSGYLSVTLPKDVKGFFEVDFYGSNINKYQKTFYYDTRYSSKKNVEITDYFQDADISGDFFDISFWPHDSTIKVDIEDATIKKLDSYAGHLSVTLPKNKRGSFVATFYGNGINRYQRVFYYDTRHSIKDDIEITDYFQGDDDLYYIYFEPFDSTIKADVKGARINELNSSDGYLSVSLPNDKKSSFSVTFFGTNINKYQKTFYYDTRYSTNDSIEITDYFQDANGFFNIYFKPHDSTIKVDIKGAEVDEFNSYDGYLSVTLPKDKKGYFTAKFYGSNIVKYTKVFYYDTRTTTSNVSKEYEVEVTAAYQREEGSDNLFDIYFVSNSSNVNVDVKGASINQLDVLKGYLSINLPENKTGSFTVEFFGTDVISSTQEFYYDTRNS